MEMKTAGTLSDMEDFEFPGTFSETGIIKTRTDRRLTDSGTHGAF
jgi:hypothetical protein